MISTIYSLRNEVNEDAGMRIPWFVGAVLVTVCVGLLAAIGAGSLADPFAAMSRLGAYVMTLGGIFAGVLLSLALSLSVEREEKRKGSGPPRPQDL